MTTITAVRVEDIRFPTSQSLDGSDAMNPDPDYSSAYVVISTDAGDSGNGFVFTIGRGNDVVVRACAGRRATPGTEGILSGPGARAAPPRLPARPGSRRPRRSARPP